jgi:hypothetical protein
MHATFILCLSQSSLYNGMFKIYFGPFYYWVKIKHLLFSLSNVLILIVRID